MSIVSLDASYSEASYFATSHSQVNPIDESAPSQIFLRKRLAKDLNNLSNITQIHISDFYIDSENNANVTIIDSKYSTYNTYSFCLRFYPFYPPKIRINNVEYTDFLKITNPYFSSRLNNIYNIDCLCCNSCTCPNNWGPLVSLNKIIDEIRLFRRYRRDIINVIMCEKIKNRYLIDDIDLSSWLLSPT